MTLAEFLKEVEEHGHSEWPTGGGCAGLGCHYSNTHWYSLITDHDDPSIPNETTTHVTLGIYDHEGACRILHGSITFERCTELVNMYADSGAWIDELVMRKIYDMDGEAVLTDPWEDEDCFASMLDKVARYRIIREESDTLQATAIECEMHRPVITADRFTYGQAMEDGKGNTTRPVFSHGERVASLRGSSGDRPDKFLQYICETLNAVERAGSDPVHPRPWTKRTDGHQTTYYDAEGKVVSFTAAHDLIFSAVNLLHTAQTARDHLTE